MPLELVAAELLAVDPDLQGRADGLDGDHVAALAAALGAGEQLPPGQAYRDESGAIHMYAGHHRKAARLARGERDIPLLVEPGTRRQAVLAACRSNSEHLGLRRTNADKRRVVGMMLRDAEWRAWSDHRIAEACGVSQQFVANVRADLAEAGVEQPTNREGRDGRRRQLPTVGSSKDAANCQPLAVDQEPEGQLPTVGSSSPAEPPLPQPPPEGSTERQARTMRDALAAFLQAMGASEGRLLDLSRAFPRGHNLPVQKWQEQFHGFSELAEREVRQRLPKPKEAARAS